MVQGLTPSLGFFLLFINKEIKKENLQEYLRFMNEIALFTLFFDDLIF